MITDLHCHTNFSIDCPVSPDLMLKAAENKGIDILTFTDHADFAQGDSCVDPDKYISEIRQLCEKSRQVKLLCGIETGLQFEHREKFAQFMKNREFDFVIGSMHRAGELDFFNGEFYAGRTAEDCWKIYLEETLKAINSCSDFDVLGHFDIIARYDHLKGKMFPEKLLPELDRVLVWLIKNGKGLEINTSGIFYQLNRCHPEQLILKRYKDLGGKILTIGSDAHREESVGRNLKEGYEAASIVGFTQVAWFEKRKIHFAEF